MNGASSRVTVSRHSYSVANAAAPSGSAGPTQNRRRERRTYQFDRSSMNAESRRPARAESNASSAESTSATVACSSDSAQRSSSGRSAGSGAGYAPGVQAGASGRVGSAPAAFAYRTKNDAVFQYVSSSLRTTSSSCSWPTRRFVHGLPPHSISQRTASAPWRSNSSCGSSTLPRCLLILRPSVSSSSPRHSTVS